MNLITKTRQKSGSFSRIFSKLACFSALPADPVQNEKIRNTAKRDSLTWFLG
jgi:hypothetical protein